MAELTSFHRFPDLPIELRLKIWGMMLPSRVVLPESDCDSRLIFGEHNGEMQKTRPIPAIFSGNGESRSFCLEQYVPFAKTYIHPTHDILFFSNEDEKKFWLYYPSFYHIPDHPLDRVRSVAIEVEYETLKDFGGHLHWLRGLGSPQELIICLAPSFQTSVLLADHYLRTFGTRRVMDSSNRAQLVRWPGDIDQELVHRVRTRLIQALQEEKNTFPDFRVPVVRGELYFAYFDPEYWV